MNPESDDKNNDSMGFIHDGNSDVKKVWVIDWNGRFEKASIEERTNYLDALKIFNERAQEGKNTILYEVQKSISDGKILKRVPILNSSKYSERKKNLSPAKREQAIKKEGVFSSSKSRLFILLGIIISFIVAIYFINVLASGGIALSHHVILDIMADNAVEGTLMIVLYF